MSAQSASQNKAVSIVGVPTDVPLGLCGLAQADFFKLVAFGTKLIDLFEHSLQDIFQ